MRIIGSKTNILILAIVLCSSILLTIFSERIPLNGGLGWDGSVYGRMVKEFEKFPHIPNVNTLHARRFVPSGVIYCVLTALNLPRNNINIIHAFQIYNIVLLVLVGYVWVLISDELQISNKGKWLGFMALFLNNAVLKFFFYYPVLTDVTALFFVILMVYFWLRDNKVGLVVVSFLGAFTWPTLIYQGLILYMFPRKKAGGAKPKYYLNYLLGIVTGLAFLGGAIYFTNGFTPGMHSYQNLFPKNLSLMSCLPLSVALCVLYAFMVVRTLFDNNYFFNIKSFFHDIRFSRLLIALPCYGISLFLIRFITSAEAPYSDYLPHMLVRVFSAGLARPFEFYIAHVFYFGPILILTFCFFDSFCKAVQSFGWGLLLVCLMNLVLTINPVSRSSLTAFYPIIVVLTVLSVDKYILDDTFLKYFAVISLLLSRVWLSYNKSEDWCASYFNNYGAYMNNKVYFVQAAIVVFLLFMGYFYLRRNNIEERGNRLEKSV